MKLLSALIQISRPLNFLITFFTIIVAGIISSTNNFQNVNIFLAALSGGLTASAGNIINDYFDFNSDKINHPKRVLPSGLLNLNQALIIYFILIIFSLIISFFINTISFLIVLLSTILLFLYSLRLKKIPLLGNFTVAFLTGMAFIFGGIAVNNIYYAVIPAVFAFLINFIREMIKDMEDIEGDSKNGIKTFSFVYGFSSTKKIILFLTIALIASTFYPYLIHEYKIEYFIIIIVVVNPLLIFVLRSIYKNDSRENLNNLSFILKLEMIFGLTAIYFGK